MWIIGAINVIAHLFSGNMFIQNGKLQDVAGSLAFGITFLYVGSIMLVKKLVDKEEA